MDGKRIQILDEEIKKKDEWKINKNAISITTIIRSN